MQAFVLEAFDRERDWRALTHIQIGIPVSFMMPNEHISPLALHSVVHACS